MFNYYDTHLIGQEDFIKDQVTYELNELFNSCVKLMRAMMKSHDNNETMPSALIIHNIITMVFYQMKYLEAKGIEPQKYLKAFEEGVLKNIDQSPGIRVNTIWKYPMFIANEDGDTYTKKSIREEVLKDLDEKVKVVIQQQTELERSNMKGENK